jgi:LuxR family maltose regulon positive regulatory protein
LTDQLDQGERARLTLVVGSAGAGKTILLADWLASRPDRSSAWLTCDPADSDPVRFLAAVIEALRRAAGGPDLGEDARQVLGADGAISADTIASLADDVERVGAPLVLVIDDFQLTGGGGVEVLTWLLDYRPGNLQVVLATRVDPPLRLHRMRANGGLVELRDRDLSFSAEETKRLLAGFGVQLDEPDLEVVQRRSEGWVAGLQMAAIAIQHRPDPKRVVDRVELKRHTVTGYFLDEVLYRQPDAVVRFMLATSILDELSAGACTVLCGPGAGALLEQVYRDHLFLSLVDEEAGTYRYHHLIKEVLEAELRARDPEGERQLHERAAQHLANTGRVGPAARHLLDAGDATTAFRLLSDGVIVDVATNPSLGSALDDIQPDDFANTPTILIPLAAELLLRGDFGRGSRAFELADLTASEAVDQPDLAVRFAAVGAMYHQFRGEVTEALAHRDRAHHFAARTAGSETWIAGVDSTAMYCHLYLGNFAEALQLADAVATAEITPPAAREVLCAGIRSQVAWARGQLSEAEDRASRALASAYRLGFERHYFAFNSHRTRALLALERGELKMAAELTEQILDMLDGGRPTFDFLAQLDRARIWAAAGNPDEALASLPAARNALRSERSILLARADELEARLRLALGDPAGALTIAGLLPDDRRAVVSALIQLKVGNPERAQALLGTLPEKPWTIRAAVEWQLLGADLALVQRSRQTARLVREVLDVVEGQGFVQTVLETAPHLVEHLMSEFEQYPRSDHLAAILRAATVDRDLRAAHPQGGSLPDPLTDAEIRVLKRLPLRLTYADIASDLHLSLNTVKTHLRRSYMKLGVSSRSAAIKRAASLGCL